MKIVPFPVRQTNLMHLVIGPNNSIILVDPIEPQKIKDYLQNQNMPSDKVIVLTTHGHEDHNSGNLSLNHYFPEAQIFAGSERSFAHSICQPDQIIPLDHLTIQCIHIPGHTLDSFAFFLQDHQTQQKILFPGDTLFYLGCGKIFEGTPTMMYHSLAKLTSLPPDTLIFYGHNYTEPNLRFRQHILNQDPPSNLPPTNLTIEQEKQYNLFLNPSLLSHHPDFTHLTPIQSLARLRHLKDHFTA
ncbi:hydroxyacylglutathione hydrolase [Nematocida homosporus]|uniref:hydroxyacylglutathione hydrolase n=1 Tax=Nematocida homosporus TaxID=1912981 RepID=UPI00221E9977|nr:hydroxyacylglutathione hydrolase [Nematocida homosporus]KAI5186685.1 hydroxyacylglutathione hydrolase [Nematocida homosporus]